MSLTIGARLARVGPVRLGAYKRLSRNDVEDIGLAALAALLFVVAFDALKVAAWIVYELLRLSWRGLRWLWRRERAAKASKATASSALVLAAAGSAAALILGGVAHADPSDSPGDPSDIRCYPGAIYCPPPRYSQWSRDDGNANDCQWLGGRWISTTGPCNGSRS
jgi:hypothetical protein